MVLKSEVVCLVNLIGYVSFFTFGPILYYILPESLLFPTYLALSLILGILHCIDVMNSDCFSKNYQIMKDTGLSDTEIWSSAFIAHFGLQIPIILMLKYVLRHNNHSDWIELSLEEHFSPYKILLCFFTVWATDSLFFFMHKFLHEKLPRIHLLHHCCVYSSMSVNAFFHPLDIAMEFAAPATTVCLISLYVFQDPWTFVLSVIIMQNWYGLSHDEWIHLDHVNHHRHCAPGYFAYHNFFYSDPKTETVRCAISEFQQRKMKRLNNSNATTTTATTTMMQKQEEEEEEKNIE